MGTRSTLLLVAMASAGCSLPDRDNPHDSNVAPIVRMAVRDSSGSAVFEGTRAQALYIDLTESSVGKGSISRVTLEQLDPRTEEELTEECPYQEPVELVTLDSSLTWQWSVHPNPCFEREGGRMSQRVRLRATARSTGGGIGKETLDFRLLNFAPVAVVGAAQWVDPSWSTVAIIDNSLHVDLDPDDVRRDIWELVAGPRLLTLGSNLGATFEIDLADPANPEPYFGSVYILRVTSCDPWECSEPQLLEVHLERAIWATTNDSIVQLDPTFAAATVLDDGSGTVAFSIAGNSRIAPARDGIRIFTPSIATSRRVRGDMVARPVALPGVFQTIAGSDGFGTVWVSAGPGGSIALYEIGDDDTSVGVAPGFGSSLASRSLVTRHSPGLPLWIGGFDVTYFRFARSIPGGSFESWDFPNGDPAIDCLGDGDVRTAAGAPDGTAWFGSETGIVHLALDGTVLSCDELNIGSNTLTDMDVVTDAEGGDQLLFVEQFDGPPSAFTPNYVRRLIPGTDTSEILLDGSIMGNGLAIDRRTGEIVVVTQEVVLRFPPDSFDQAIAQMPTGVIFPDIGEPIFQGFQVALEPTGRTWLLRSDGLANVRELIRMPPAFELVRGVFGGTTANPPRLPDQAAVDPSTGRLWVAEIQGGEWSAVSFDERGTEWDRVSLPFAQVDPESLVIGVSTIRVDPGTASRPAGLWVQDLYETPPMTSPELRVSWVAIAGTGAPVTFGLGEPNVTDGFPNDSFVLFRGPRTAIDPQDGSLWIAIHDENGADARLGEVYRLQSDGSVERFSSQSLLIENDLLATGAVATRFGFFAAGATDNLIRSRSGTGSSNIAICSAADHADATFHDIGAGVADPAVTGGEIATYCVDDGDAHYVTRAREGTFVAISLRAPADNPFAVDLFGPKPGTLGGVTGNWYMPEGNGIRIYDRYLSDTGVYDMPGRINYFPR